MFATSSRPCAKVPAELESFLPEPHELLRLTHCQLINVDFEFADNRPAGDGDDVGSSEIRGCVDRIRSTDTPRLHPIQELVPDEDGVYLTIGPDAGSARPRISDEFDHIVLAVLMDVVREFKIDIVNDELLSVAGKFMRLGPTEASSAVLAALAWSAEVANTFTIPPGFDFLFRVNFFGLRLLNTPEPSLLACTFVDCILLSAPLSTRWPDHPHILWRRRRKPARRSHRRSNCCNVAGAVTKTSWPRSGTILHTCTTAASLSSAIRSRPSCSNG